MDGGFGIYIIQKKNISNDDLSTIYLTNLFIAILLYLCIFLFSDSIALFFEIINFSFYLKVLGIILILNSLSIVQFSLIEKNLKFNHLFKINIISLLISSIFAFIFAILEYGIWSLIFFYLINSFLKTILFIYYSEWLPSLVFKIKLLRNAWLFSKNILLSSLVDASFSRVINFIIGKVGSPAELGFYEQANKTKEIPTYAISNSLRRVYLPVFSKLRGKNESIKIEFKKAIKLISFISIPLTFILFYFSESIVTILFSEKWIKSSYYLEILSFTVLPYILFYVNIDLFKANGNSKKYMQINLLSKTIGLLLILITSMIGIDYVLYSFVLTYWFSFFYVCKFSINYSGISLKNQFFITLPFFLKSTLCFILVFLLKEFVDIDDFKIIELSSFILFIFTYIAMNHKLSKAIFFKILRYNE